MEKENRWSRRFLLFTYIALSLLSGMLAAQAQGEPEFFAQVGKYWEEAVGGKSGEYLQENGVVVVGSQIGAAEEGLMLAAGKAEPDFERMARIDDSILPFEAENKYTVIFLVGAPVQNRLTDYYEYQSGAKFTKISGEGELVIIKKAVLENGGEVVVLSLSRGYQNYAKQNVAPSPLAAVVDEKIVPMLATLLAAATLWLLPHVSRIFRAVFGKYVTSKAKEGKKIEDKGASVSIFGTTIFFREAAAVSAAAAVFGLGAAWTFGANTSYLLKLVGINIMVSAVVFFGQGALRIIVAKLQNVKTEFRLWVGGALVTLLSAALGNMFSTTGYVVEEDMEEGNKAGGEEAQRRKIRKAARLRVAIVLVTAVLGFLFFAANLLHPHKAFQLFMFICTLSAATDLLPFAPLPGAIIRKWNGSAYFALAGMAWAAYLAASII